MHYLVRLEGKKLPSIQLLAVGLVDAMVFKKCSKNLYKGISFRGKYALFGLVWWSPKLAAEVTIAMSLVWRFQKGISCRGKYALFGLVWFRGHPNQLHRSLLHCP